MIGNTFGNYSKRYGGSFPAWRSVKGKETSGGVLETVPSVGTVIPAGTLVSLPSAGGTAKIVKTYEVKEAVLTSATTAKVIIYPHMLKPEVGEFYMIAPEKVSAVGTGVKLNKIEADSSDQNGITYTLTFAAAPGEISAGGILVKATAAGASAKVYAVPTGMSENDVYIDEGTEYATISSVFDGVIWEDRVQPVPECFKEKLPQIKFEKGV